MNVGKPQGGYRMANPGGDDAIWIRARPRRDGGKRGKPPSPDRGSVKNWWLCLIYHR